MNTSTKMTLIQVILLFCCASVAFCLPTSVDFESDAIGSEYCAQGQVAWCKDIFAATDCNAVNHCIQSVWLTQQPPSNTGACDTCLTIVKKFRRLDSNKTKEIFEELLENICSVSRITEFVRKRCEKYVDRYVDPYFNKFLDLLESKVDPVTVCHLLHLCANSVPTSLVSEKDGGNDEYVVVVLENVVLHFPAHFTDSPRSKELLGSAECSWDPSYWCNNVTSAEKCQATSHCIQNVWPLRQFDEDDDSVCNICKDMVKIAGEEIASEKTENDLKRLFEHSCNLIPIEEVRADCINLTNKYIDQLIKLLASRLNPTATCSLVGLCNSARIDNLLEILTTPPDESAALCTKCMAAFTAVERFLKHAPRRTVLDKLLLLCGQLSSYSDGCSNLVSLNFAQIYDWLLKEMHPLPVCHLSGMCAHHYHLHPSPIDDVDMETEVEIMLITADSNVACDLCKEFVTSVKNILIVNTTELEFRNMLEGLCKQTGKFKDECLTVVDDSATEIYQFLTTELNPTELCGEVDLCPRKFTITDEGLNLNHDQEYSMSDDTQISDVSAEKQVGNLNCEFCILVMKIVQKDMHKPEYQHDVKKLLEHVCTTVPKHVRNKCSHFISKFSNVLVNILVHQTDPHTVCSALQVCLIAPPVEPEFCQLCQDVMHFVQDHLQGQDLDEIKNVLKKVCGFVPKFEASKCKTFIEDYFDLIVGLLYEELDPLSVCPALKLCPSSLTSAEQCFQCQRIMTDLTKQVGNDISEFGVSSKLADLVPAKNNKLTALQLKLIHHDDIVDMIAAEFDAQESCVFLRFCDPSLVVLSNGDITNKIEDVSNEVISATESSAHPYCALCEMIIQRFEKELVSNSSVEKLEEKLRKFCAKLQNPELRANCSLFITHDIPKLMDLLNKEFKPKMVCSAAHLCPLQLPMLDHFADEENEAERCEFCEAVVSSYERFLSDSPHLSVGKLVQVCSLFSNEDVSHCMEIVSHVASLLETSNTHIPSWFYCVNMGKCSHGAHLTYKAVCVDPSQWCVDVKKALLCNKVTFCQQNIWKSEKPSL